MNIIIKMLSILILIIALNYFTLNSSGLYKNDRQTHAYEKNCI